MFRHLLNYNVIYICSEPGTVCGKANENNIILQIFKNLYNISDNKFLKLGILQKINKITSAIYGCFLGLYSAFCLFLYHKA